VSAQSSGLNFLAILATPMPATDSRQPIALILSGGGARAAYQVGVLRAIADVLSPGTPLPFPIVCGNSAGALNAAFLAADGRHFDRAVRSLEQLWTALSPTRSTGPSRCCSWRRAADGPRLLPAGQPRSAARVRRVARHRRRWRAARALGRFQGIQSNIDEGFVKALAITASRTRWRAR
jgi:NTE family protein